MSNQDNISDLLTRIRNATMVNHSNVKIPFFKFGYELCLLLKEQGYVSDVAFAGEGVEKVIHVALKYDKNSHKSVIGKIKRMSRPGLRRFEGVSDIPRVQGGLGIMVVSTNLGKLLTDHQARQHGVGGELICSIETG